MGRYEVLRAHALGETPIDVTPLGVVLLRRYGLTAWMVAEASVVCAVPAVEPVTGMGPEWRGPTETRGARLPLPPPPQSELVGLLASTALLVARESWR